MAKWLLARLVRFIAGVTIGAMTIDPLRTIVLFGIPTELLWDEWTRLANADRFSFRLPSCNSAVVGLTSAPNPSTYKQSVTFTATLAVYPVGGAAPSGTITLTDGASVLTTFPVSSIGNFTYSTAALSIGTHRIKASYSGDANYPSGTATVLQVVNTNDTDVLTSAPNPSSVGQSVTFTTTVATTVGGATPSGTITLTNFGKVLTTGTLNGSGQLVYSTAALPAGSNPLQAIYSGDATYAPITSTVYIQYVNSNATPIVNGTCDEAALDAALAQGGYITFNCPNPTTITVTGPNLTTFRTITQTTTLDGTANNQNITISGGGNTSLFLVPANINFGLKGLTLANANDSTNAVVSSGGIDNHGNITITSCTFTNNTSSAFGGAIFIHDGAATIISSTFTGNSAANNGGALLIDNSQVSVANSTFTGNASNGPNGGGGIYSQGSVGTNLTVTNSTFSGNNASYLKGGALYLNAGTTATIVNATVVSNTAVVNAGGIRANASAVFKLQNTIIANNTAPQYPDVQGTVNSLDYNLIKDITGITFSGTTTHNITGQDPLYGPLANNGGPTQTRSLYVGSPARGVVATGCLATDQRGVARPASGCDIGAFQSTVPTVVLTSAPNPSTIGQSVTFTATVGNNGLATSGTVTFTDSISGTLGTATLNASGVASLTFSNLASRVYTITALYGGDLNNSSATSNTLIQNVTSYIYNLPFLANNYASGTGSFTTFLAFQNTGSASANVTIQYYDATGTPLAASTVVTSVAKYGELIGANPLALGSRGAGVITSNQPLAVIVAEATPYGGSAYAVNAGAGNTLNAPFAFRNTFGGYTTQLTVFNAGSSPVTATVNFYDNTGTLASAASQSFSVGAKQSYSLDQGAASSNIPSGFNGWAQVSSPVGSQLVAQVLEQNPGIRYVSIVNAQTGSSSTAYAPAIFNNAYGSFITGADIVNTNSTPVTVTVNYYSITGTLYAASPFTLAGYALTSIYHGGTGAGPGVAGTGLPSGFAGAASVTSQGGGVIVAVNEFGGYTSAGTTESGTYSAASSGNSTVGLPVIANNGFGYTTGTTIFNTSSQTVSGTLQYYDLSGNAVGTAQTLSIGANASAAYYQGSSAQGLSSGFYGVAVITQTGGPANSLIDTTNAVSASFFYTYVEPTQ